MTSTTTDEATAQSTDRPAILVLEDGTCFEGRSVGAKGVAIGEAVFNTSMSGYQEILSDPSYAGQLVCLTVPHVGNYGVNPRDMESERAQVAGLIVRSMSAEASNQRAEANLPAWLDQMGVVAITEVDTRALTRHLRDKGAMMALIAHDQTQDDAPRWVEHLAAQPGYDSRDFVEKDGHARVGVNQIMAVRVHPIAPAADHEDLGEAQVEFAAFDAETSREEACREDARPHVVVVDYGVKFSILRNLARQGLRMTIVPATTHIDRIRELDPDGILLSNGPGDPARMDALLETVRAAPELCPTFGICLGHQLLARAFGARTFKLAFGHRGPNQPVKELQNGRILMTSQNHGYAVEADTLPDELEATHINLNDQTVEGFRHRTLPVLSVQYHPEAGPGPQDAVDFFADFARMVSRERT